MADTANYLGFGKWVEYYILWGTTGDPKEPYLLVFIFAFLLSACGGGGGGSVDTSAINSKADAAYTGSRVLVSLDKNNTMDFVSLMIEADVDGSVALRKGVVGNKSFFDLSRFDTFSFKKNAEDKNFASRSETVACAAGGERTLHVDDDTPNQGNIVFSQCNEDGEVLNGTIGIIYGDNSITYAYDAFSVSSNSVEVLQTGTSHREEMLQMMVA